MLFGSYLYNVVGTAILRTKSCSSATCSLKNCVICIKTVQPFDVRDPDTHKVLRDYSTTTRLAICGLVVSVRSNENQRLADVTRRASDRFRSFVF